MSESSQTVTSRVGQVWKVFRALTYVSQVLIVLALLFLLIRAYYGGATLGLRIHREIPSPRWHTQGFWSSASHFFWCPDTVIDSDWRGKTSITTTDGYIWDDNLHQYVKMNP